MPTAPEQYKAPTPEGDDIDTYKSPSAKRGQEGNRGLYQSYRYQKFRARIKRQQRIEDEERVHDLYQSMESRSFTDYQRWLAQDNPLCVECLDKGLIKPGRVMDHIEPIEKGGAVYDPDNLQWMCDPCHDRKRATDDKK